MGEDPIPELPATAVREFSTTHWSEVVAAGDAGTPQSAEALESLCRAYWFPLYAYVRRQGSSPEEAEDLTQAFFAGLFQKCVQHAHPESGRFRTFLLTSFKRFVISEWRRTTRRKRGGAEAFVSWDAAAAEQSYAAEPPSTLTSDEVYERHWGITVMGRAVEALRAEYRATGRDRLFDALQRCVWGNEPSRPYAELAAELGSSEGAVKTAIHRLRQRCRDIVRAEVARTVARPGDVDEELRHLIEVLSRSPPLPDADGGT